jgi:flavin-dependent thymidylate synthase
MKVTLLDYTGAGCDPWYAADLMIFTKNTRIKMTPDGLNGIRAWDEEKKLAELSYMANTIRASWEFVDYQFMIEDVTRALTHQLVRHRHASFAQQTQQVLNVKGFTVEMPDFLGKYGEEMADKSGWQHSEKSAEMEAIWYSVVKTIAQAYDRLQELGATVEEARGLLPTNVHTNIFVKMNLRTLVDFFHSRISPRNLGEISRMALAMREAILDVHPWARVFIDQTMDKVMADMDRELADLRTREPEKATAMLKLVDQIRRAG